MPTSARATHGAADRQSRRKRVETVLQALGRPAAARRLPPPDGRLGADEAGDHRLRQALSDLGPVFASFGRYLSSRVDLLPRRTRAELGAIAGTGAPIALAAIADLIRTELGSPRDRLFFEFHETPFAVDAWSARHLAWLAPGVPARVTIVRPGAAAKLDADAPLLALLAPWLGVSESVLSGAA